MLSWFIGPIGRWFAGGAVILAVIGGIYAKGNLDGRHAVKVQWDAAIQADIAKADKNRADADRSIILDPTTRELCRDKWQRDPC